MVECGTTGGEFDLSRRPAALDCDNLVKSFGAVTAVAGISLSIRSGELYALLGPNGAGKTTVLRMIAGLARPDFGEIYIDGISALKDPTQARRRLAYLPDEPLLYGKLTPLEYLDFISILWNVPPSIAQPRAKELLDRFELSSKTRQYTDTLSAGMRQKLALAGALIHDPSLLLLDEPLTGLDAAAARGVKDLLIDITRAGGTVVLTTHILDVAERLAGRLGIIAQGKLVAQGTLGELKAGVGEDDATLERIFLGLTSNAT